MMLAVRLSNLVPVLCVVAVLVFLVHSRKHRRRPPPSSKYTLVLPVSHLRLADEIRPVERRWQELDVEVIGLLRERARLGKLPDVDWPALIREGLALLGQAAQADQHFARDMAGLNVEQDPVTGISHVDFIQHAYPYVDCLGRCTMALSGLITRMHRMEEEKNTQLSKDFKKKSEDYVKLKVACLKTGSGVAAWLEAAATPAAPAGRGSPAPGGSHGRKSGSHGRKN